MNSIKLKRQIHFCHYFAKILDMLHPLFKFSTKVKHTFILTRIWRKFWKWFIIYSKKTLVVHLGFHIYCYIPSVVQEGKDTFVFLVLVITRSDFFPV